MARRSSTPGEWYLYRKIDPKAPASAKYTKKVALTFQEARDCVIAHARRVDETEQVAVRDAAGRVTARSIAADRDYPPFHRSARDGYAVRFADLPGLLNICGEVRAGEVFAGSIGAGEAVEIMTGAPLPAGADAVVMIEHTVREGTQVRIDRTVEAGDNFTRLGAEARAGAAVLAQGRRIGFTETGALAMVGCECVEVWRKPRVAIISTGDEIVEVGQRPETFQIRNSNAWALFAQVSRSGAIPEILPIARDNYDSTRAAIELGLESDLLLLSGGVSAGKYDIVEKVLADLGAEFFFDRVKIQPGQPLVYGEARGKQFFGLPGNPASTMVTYEIFARAAVELLGGVHESPLPLLRARLASEFRHKTGLTRFLPAQLSADGSTVTPEPWHGSGDIAALARANAFLVADADRESWAAGEDIRVLTK